MQSKVIVFATIFLLFLTFTPFQRSTAQTRSGELKRERQEKRQEVRENLQERRKELQEEFKTRLQTIRDERKRAVVDRINTKIVNINKRRTDRMKETIRKLRNILERINQKAQNAKVVQAQAQLRSAEEAVNAQATKQYVIEIGSEQTLKATVGSVVSQLTSDLRATHKAVIEAKQQVQAAARELAKLRKENRPANE